MKRLLALITGILLFATILKGQSPVKPFVIPELTEWTASQGTSTLSGRVIVRSSQLASTARLLVEQYNLLTGKQLILTKGKQKNGDIILEVIDDKTLGDEGYILNISNTICISASSNTGLFWGTQTLLQMINQDGLLQRGTARDIPQYKLRGLMIDVARKFVPIDYLRNLVKIMSYYKMNTLQIHLNDNGFRQYFENDWNKTPAAFRLECETYPGLTAKDGSYTKQEFRDLQKLAEKYHIEIIPEIDAPAHALAFTHYRPEIASENYGKDHLDLFNPKTYTFLDALYKEYLEGKDPVFRGPRVNIGTDEYSNADKKVVEKFRAFTDHYLALIEKYNKQPMLWGALTHANGETKVRSKGVLMNIWYNGYADPTEMKKQGYELVSIPDGYVYIVPAAGYYYDYLNCQFLYNNWTPAQIGNKKFKEQDPSIRGGMFAIWNDHYGNGISTKDIHDRLYPALQTLSVKCWTGQKTTFSYASFDSLRTQLSEAPGVNELGRLPQEILKLNSIYPNTSLALPVIEAGYGNTVALDIDCCKEDNGTILTQSHNSIFYLADPKEGKLGFSRDGYLNCFNYRLPTQGKVNIRIVMTNRETQLYIDGKHKETLGAQKVWAIYPENKLNTMPDAKFIPTVYAPVEKNALYYQRTLFFPLQKTGNFKSKVSNLTISVTH